MSDKPDDLIIRFLLDELAEEERAEVEVRFLSDNNFFEEVLAAEDALLDQYLLGQLGDDRRERAETLFRLSHRQRREAEFTEGLIISLRETETEDSQPATPVRPTEPTGRGALEETATPVQLKAKPSRDTFPWIPASLRGMRAQMAWLTILLVCFLLLAVVFYQYSRKKGSGKEDITAGRSRQEVGHTPPEENRSEVGSKQLPNEEENQEKTEELIAKAPPPKPNRITSIVLTPAAPERSSGPRTSVFNIQGPQVRLHLTLDKNWRYGSYDLLMTTFEGRKVWGKESVSADQAKGGRLTFSLPSSLLQPEDYRIELRGRSETGDLVHAADYIFKVRK